MEQKTQWEKVVEELKLEGHVQGGFFKQTYRGPILPTNNRATMTMIYYLITKGHPQINWRKLKSDQISCHIRGGRWRFIFIHSDGKIEENILSGNVLEKGQTAQLLIPADVWSTAYLEDGQYSLCTQSVAPGFQYEDMQISTTDELMEKYPQHKERLEKIRAIQMASKKN